MTSIDWGTAPAWASAIGTSGSLLLGFAILLRDRRKEERQEAQKIVIHFNRDDKNVKVHLLNTADRPILLPRVLCTGQVQVPFGQERVGPGEETTADISLYIDGNRTFPLAVLFLDGDGYRWARDLQTRDVIRVRHIKRRAPNTRLLLRPHTWGAFARYWERRRSIRRA
ncbi:hypothetical protein ACFYY2_31195 [Streptomyces sp. NPDC001822]|uniref:hypothetical protein n=1 Tax=Streptomyces sp. NPDC001822 TaxID=3364614 RepID=UPI0036AE0E30